MTHDVEPSDTPLPAATRLGTVHLQVSDLDRSIGYYENVLGLRVLERSGHVAHMAAYEATSALVHLHWGAGTRPTRRNERLGLYHFALLLPDRAALGRFVEHLVSTGIRIAASDHSVSEATYLWDPDGLGIEVYADRPRSLWRRRRNEIVMTVDPLDLQDVVQEAGGAKWEGMPGGTVLGHMHLHVGDLGEAERFYHRALGFDKTLWSLPGALFLSAGGYHHHLATNTWAERGIPARDDEARLLEWEIVMPGPAEIPAVVERFESFGYRVHSDGSTYSVRDPWNTALRLVTV